MVGGAGSDLSHSVLPSTIQKKRSKVSPSEPTTWICGSATNIDVNQTQPLTQTCQALKQKTWVKSGDVSRALSSPTAECHKHENMKFNKCTCMATQTLYT